MKWKKYLPELISVLIALAAGAIGGIATMKGLPAYEQLVKPALTPPAVVFPIVWTILYILMGISSARIWKSNAPSRRTALGLYWDQLLINILWSLAFFGLQAHFFAFLLLLLLWGLILAMILAFYKIDPLAGLLQIPYLIWVTFAGYLNLGIWLLNR